MGFGITMWVDILAALGSSRTVEGLVHLLLLVGSLG